MLRRSLRAFVAAIAITLAQVLAPMACSPSPAIAASGTDTKTVTLSTEYRHQLDNQEAYCTDSTVSPPPVGTKVSSWTSGPLLLDYVLYHSDGGYDVQYGWEPTRYAVWAIMHNDTTYLTTYASGESMPEQFSTQVKAIYQAAKDWVADGATGPERGCSRIYAPTSNEYQPLAICVPQLGDVSLVKASALAGISEKDACYSLAEAQYTLYSDAACTSPVTVLTTDENGEATATEIGQGTYWVRESKAPRGFARNQETYQIEVLPLQTVEVNGGEVSDLPLYTTVGPLLRKGDAELIARGDEVQAQGDASLSRAIFEMRRYANTMGDASGEAVRSWTIQTDADGITTLDDAHLVGGDEPYRDAEGAVVLPLGTYTIEEVAAPEGYLTDSQSCSFVVEQQGSRAVMRTIDGPTRTTSQPGTTQFLVSDSVIRGGVRLGKVDAERLDHVAQGGATLAGAVLALELTSDQPVIVDGSPYAQGSVVATLTTGEDGTAATACDALPYGSYVAYEISAPEGYMLTGRNAWSLPFEIREDGVLVDLSEADTSVPDQVKRGDLSFVKVDGQSMRRMPGVPFVIESLTTGERHVLVTDDNGQCSTSALFNSHTHETNGNDILLGEPMVVALQTEVADEAVAEPNEEPADETGEEPGTPAEASELELTEAPATEEVATEETLPTDETDVVEEPNLTAASSDESFDASCGVWFSGGTDWTTSPDDSMGALPYDTYRITELRCVANEGYDLVSFEVRVSRDNFIIDGGTVDDHALPTIQTSLAVTSSTDGANTWQLVDTVFFNNLSTDGTEYELRGTLHLVGDDGSDEGVLTDAVGSPVEACVTFVPRASSGTVEMPFELDVRDLRGCTVVAYEELWRDDELLATHADPTDAEQSVTVPRIGTTLRDADGESDTLGAGQVTLYDTVRYEGLVPGKSYVVSGTLMDKMSGTTLIGTDGLPVQAQSNLRPDTPSGEVLIAFTFDGFLCPGHTVVAFESLLSDDVELAVHADLDDEDQSVSVVGMGTTATDALDGDHTLLASPDAVVNDVVSYQGLIPGLSYELQGVVVDRATGEPLVSEMGAVAAELSFTPEEADGYVEMTFAFDANELQAREITVFERLYRDGRLVAVHEDLSSEDQSLTIPGIRTVATSSDGDKVLDAQSDQRIIDTIIYEGLEPDSNYLVSGVIHLRDKNGGDAGPLLDKSGRPVTASAPLVPEASYGEFSLAFDIDTSELDECELVVYELLLDAETELPVATHEDITDGGQSVVIREPSETPGVPTVPTTSTPKRVTRTLLPKTGDIQLPIRALLISAVLALALGLVTRLQDRRTPHHPRHLDND